MNHAQERAIHALLASLKESVETLDANPATKPLADAVKAAETARVTKSFEPEPVRPPVRKEP